MATPLGKKLNLLQIGERDVTKMPVLDVEQCAAPTGPRSRATNDPAQLPPTLAAPNCRRPSPP